MPPKQVRSYIVWSQIILYVGLAVCLALMPHYLLERDEGGVSNYGTYLRTVVPYTVAFGGSGCCLLLATRSIRAGGNIRQYRKIIGVIGVLQLLVLVTTYIYKVDVVLADLHIVVAVILLCAQVVGGWWFVRRVGTRVIDRSLFVVLLVTAVLVLDSAVGPFRLLLVAQLMSGLVFGVLLVRSTVALSVHEGGIMERYKEGKSE